MVNNNLEENLISKELAKGGLIGFTGSTIAKFLSIITTVIITRYLGAHDYGIYSLGLSIVMVLNIIVAFGFPHGIVKFLPGYKSKNEIEKIKSLIFRSSFISTLIGITFFIIILLSSNYISKEIFNKSELAKVLIVFSVSLIFTGIINSISSYAQAIKRIDVINLVNNIIKPISFLLLVIISLLLSLSLIGIVYSFMFSAFLTLVIAIFLLNRLFPQAFQNKYKLVHSLGNFTSFSFYTFMTGFSMILMMKIDRIMIGYFNNATAVGIYSASANIAIYLTVFLSPLISIFSPVVSELFHKGKLHELRHAFQKTSRWLILLTLPILFIFVNFSKEILSLFGKDFTNGYIVLIILSFAEIINVSTGPVGIVLKMTGFQKLDMIMGVGALISNIILNIIPLYGIVGAAVATSISLSLVNIFRLLTVKIKLNILPYNKNLLKPIGIFILLWLIYLIFLSIHKALVINILEGTMLVALYIALMFLFNILNVLKGKLNKVLHSRFSIN